MRGPEAGEVAAPPRSAGSGSALAPLRGPAFRMLWAAWLAANISMSMNDVAAAWLMTSLTDSALMVALVQAAATLPMFLLGLPSGALADIVDRRRYFALTQLWVGTVAVVLWALAALGTLSAPLLLALTLANGIGLAMRWPVFAGIIPEVVPQGQLTAALALNGMAMNASRVVGPVIAGALLAAAGSSYVFLLNAVLAVIAFVQILRWRSQPRRSELPGESLFGAMRAGLRHVVGSRQLRIVKARTFLFTLQAASLTALLPLVARDLHAGGPWVFTALLVAFGAGAVTGVLVLPQADAGRERNTQVNRGVCTHALAGALAVAAPSVWLAAAAMFLAGLAWIATANALTTAAQVALPNWVRARGMSMFQMATMAGMASGAALWGWVASLTTVATSVVAASVAGPLLLWATRRYSISQAHDEDLSPAAITTSSLVSPPALDLAGGEVPIIVTVEYLINPTRAEEFEAVMRDTRRSRLRQGAASWQLMRDIAQPQRYMETFVNPSWTEHQRFLERFTAADLELRRRRLAFLQGGEPPRIQRHVVALRG